MAKKYQRRAWRRNGATAASYQQRIEKAWRGGGKQTAAQRRGSNIK